MSDTNKNTQDEWEQYKVTPQQDEWSQYLQPTPTQSTGVMSKLAPSVSRGIMSALKASNYPVQKSLELEAQSQELLDTKAHPQFPMPINAALQVTKDFGLAKPSDYLIGGLTGMGAGAVVDRLPAIGRTLGQKMPQIMTDNWLVNKAKSVKNIVDTTIKGLKNDYQSILKPHLDTSIVKAELKAIPETIKTEFGIGADTTIGELWEKRFQILNDISDSSWDKPSYYKNPKINQAELQNAAKRIKAVVLNKLPDTARQDILMIDPKYSEALNVGRKLTKTVYESSSDTYKTTSLVNMFENKKNAGSREAFERFVKLDENLGRVKDDIGKYVKRQHMKQILKRAGGYGLALTGVGGLAGGIAGRMLERK